MNDRNDRNDDAHWLLLGASVAVLAGAFFFLGRVTGKIDAAEALVSTQSQTSQPAPTQTIEIAPGVQVFVDAKTGCQYLVGQSGYTPRIHSDGVPYCDDREEQAGGYDNVLPEAYRPATLAYPLDLDGDYARLDAIRQHPTWRF